MDDIDKFFNEFNHDPRYRLGKYFAKIQLGFDRPKNLRRVRLASFRLRIMIRHIHSNPHRLTPKRKSVFKRDSVQKLSHTLKDRCYA